MDIKMKAIISGLSVLALSACVGGEEGDDPVISSGILSLEVPDQASYDALSPDLQSLIDSVVESNESSGSATQPNTTGVTTYSGSFGLIIDQDGATISGTTEIDVDTAANADYTFSLVSIDDADNPDATVSGDFGGTAVVAGGLFNGDIDGTVGFDPDGAGSEDEIAVTIDGTLTGAFDSYFDGFGSIDGSISGAGLSTDPFYGVFHTTQN